MPSCLIMSAWSSRESWSRRARSSGLSWNGFAGAAGDAGAGRRRLGPRASAAGSRLRAERAKNAQVSHGFRKNRRETEKPPAGAAVSDALCCAPVEVRVMVEEPDALRTYV